MIIRFAMLARYYCHIFGPAKNRQTHFINRFDLIHQRREFLAHALRYSPKALRS